MSDYYNLQKVWDFKFFFLQSNTKFRMETNGQDNEEMQSESIDQREVQHNDVQNHEQNEELPQGKKSVHLGAKAKKALKMANRLAKKEKFEKAAEELQQGKFKSMWYVSIVAHCHD